MFWEKLNNEANENAEIGSRFPHVFSFHSVSQPHNCFCCYVHNGIAHQNGGD